MVLTLLRPTYCVQSERKLARVQEGRPAPSYFLDCGVSDDQIHCSVSLEVGCRNAAPTADETTKEVTDAPR